MCDPTHTHSDAPARERGGGAKLKYGRCCARGHFQKMVLREKVRRSQTGRRKRKGDVPGAQGGASTPRVMLTHGGGAAGDATASIPSRPRSLRITRKGAGDFRLENKKKLMERNLQYTE